MGRSRIRTTEENKVYDKEYQRLYYKRRKENDAEYYRLTASRCYYRKVLKKLDQNDVKYEMISQKVELLNDKVNEIINSRNRYSRMDICEEMDRHTSSE